ncbi:hypothetical protein CLOM_g22348 [Closterium sp. NIES-68]|nr:hypothetical protein CLOM_g22348 [Closterium sp. NIES-68]
MEWSRRGCREAKTHEEETPLPCHHWMRSLVEQRLSLDWIGLDDIRSIVEQGRLQVVAPALAVLVNGSTGGGSGWREGPLAARDALF